MGAGARHGVQSVIIPGEHRRRAGYEGQLANARIRDISRGHITELLGGTRVPAAGNERTCGQNLEKSASRVGHGLLAALKQFTLFRHTTSVP
jgi:hypothetical protein